MVAAELRGGNKPSLNEALGWIGSRVDDIYGANVGRLEDVWIDPGTGVPRWLLVKEGRFGGRTTLIPFEDATAGAGHVWVPYEREIVRAAPEIEPGSPLTQQVETSLRSHYAANAPAAISHHGDARAEHAQQGPGIETATIRFGSGPVQAVPPEPFAGDPAGHGGYEGHPGQAQPPPRRRVLRDQPPQQAPPQQGSYGFPEAPAPYPAQVPERQAPPIAPPEPPPPFSQPQRPVYQPPPEYAQPAQPAAPAQGFAPPPHEQFQPLPDPTPYWQPQQAPQQSYTPPGGTFDPAQGPVDALRELAGAGGTHHIEIELSGELTIRGELRSIRVTPRGDVPPQQR